MSSSFLEAVEHRSVAARRSIPLAAETIEAAAARGMRSHATFAYRGVEVAYSELPDAQSNLLFGNVLWPCAEVLSKLLVDAARGGAKVWTPAACAQLGLPLEMLLSRRFGVKVEPLLGPSGVDRLGLETLIPDVSDGTSVLEVGAGVGVTGLVCHALGARVLLTDGEARLVDALLHQQRAAAGEPTDRLRIELLDWHVDAARLHSDSHGEQQQEECFRLILGCEVLNPACEGEVQVPCVIARRLEKARGARALLLSQVRRVATCQAAVRELESHGLAVAAFRVCNGREAFEISRDLEQLVPSEQDGAHLLLVAAWPAHAIT